MKKLITIVSLIAAPLLFAQEKAAVKTPKANAKASVSTPASLNAQTNKKKVNTTKTAVTDEQKKQREADRVKAIETSNKNNSTAATAIKK